MTTPTLFVYQCSLCKTVASSPMYCGTYNCVSCMRWMRFLYSTPVETDEQKALAARGLVFNPWKVEPQPWRCVRCGDEFQGIGPTWRVDGRCCTACVRAEAITPLRTRDEIDAHDAAQDARWRQHEEDMEAAYRRAEAQQEMR